MTGRQRRGDTPTGPPWSEDVLADLHAGVLGEAESGHLWPLVQADPAARAVLAALDTTVTDLHGLGTELREPPPVPMPADLAARLDAALAAEAATRTAQSAAPPAPVIDLARRRRNRRVGWTAGLLAAAATAAATVLVVGVPHGGTAGQAVGAAPSGSATAPVALRSGQLDVGTALSAVGRSDYGPLDTPGRLATCLAANGQDPNRPPAGGARVTLDGQPGVLLVLTTGHTAQFRLLVVGPDCAAGHPDTLANTVVGGVPNLPTGTSTR